MSVPNLKQIAALFIQKLLGKGKVCIALRPPSISASSTMGEAILLGACLTGLQGLRGPLGWEPAEAAGSKGNWC